MRKKLYMIGGTMGVGKSATCRILKNRLERCAFLDGDWCWDMHPFQVTDDTKAMVLDNICHLLNGFIHCPAFDNIVFCWVMHEQAIIDDILSWLDLSSWDVKEISLVCSEQALIERLQRDVACGLRTADVIERSVARIPAYERLSTKKIDVSLISAEQAAEEILRR